ncbi:fimbrial protein [Superficieibacter sp. HKU1]|uniref:fimbrial protein n=1 Tax=Superficieibacter sp. HKU1 TaxID=3031919 RepID=UPI0023E098B5|nr:fimbrial protein [Superficieibacter sp. HKU1]WES68841.1 fimbrial protein [Superficieibacter sp. HKU1]
MSGSLVNNTTYLIANDEASGATNVGLALERKDSSGPSLNFDGSTPVIWSNDERENGLDLTAIIRSTGASGGITPGAFKAKVIFTFNYQ